MNNIQMFVKKHAIKHERAIKKICDPLKLFLGIDVFTYYRIENDGRFITLSNSSEEIDFYYAEKFHLNNPFLVSPHLLRSGTLLLNQISNDAYQECIDLQRERFSLDNHFLMIQKDCAGMNGFFLATKNQKKYGVDYLKYLGAIQTFSNHFMRSSKDLIERIKSQGFNLQNERGTEFFSCDQKIPLFKENLQIQKFIHAISNLSKREQQSLELYKLGHSAQTTAAILDLSQRTVEHYFESIKNKLGCSSKSELLKF